MKRQKRKSGKKLPMLWDETMDFEVAITPLGADSRPELEDKIIVFPLPPNIARKFPHTPPPPLAA